MKVEIPMPARVARLPRDKHGYPIPWFVAWINGIPDFRVIRAGGIDRALTEELCWICGRPRKSRSLSAFVIGPMCMVNRVAPEPPSHVDCALFSAQVCPFLTTPAMRRRETGLPEDTTDPGGIMLKRNPGATLVWITRKWTVEQVGNGRLWRLGDPVRLQFLAEGRDATRAEVLAAIESGLPLLQQMAYEEGPAAERELEEMTTRAHALLAQCSLPDSVTEPSHA